MFLEWVEKIAVADQMQRRNALMQILREESIPFAHFRQKNRDNWVENIVVSINPSPQRLVIGAHYDSVDGSTGANDNAAGVSVLIHFAREILGRTDISADLIFFDREEYVNRGSEQYIVATGKENISAMVNLDICGHGNSIAVYAKENDKLTVYRKLFDHNVLKEHDASIVGYLPNGDDSSFDSEGIPSVSIAVLPEADKRHFQYLYENYMLPQITPPEEEQKRLLDEIEVMKTMHNGPMDTISSVSEISMKLLFSYLCAGLTIS